MKNLIVFLIAILVGFTASAQTTLTGDYNFTGDVALSKPSGASVEIFADSALVQDSATTIGSYAIAFVDSAVGNDSGSVILPAVTAGRCIEVINVGDDVVAIYPASGDSIQGGAANAAIYIAVGKSAALRGRNAGEWRRLDED